MFLFEYKKNKVGCRGNSKKRGAYTSFDYKAHAHRICYSHEYIGDDTRVLKGQEPKSIKETFFSV